MIENSPTMSFDRMRSMLQRAAEVRDSEQQQIFDSLDEIHGRLAALDALGAVRKRLTDLPDRTEARALAERLDEAVTKLDAQESAVASLARVVENLVDRVVERLATPIAALDGRLDGVAGRFEGVAGRMDGLEDRLSGLHKRLDDLDHRLDKQETRLDGLPAAVAGPVTERVETAEQALRGQVEERVEALAARVEAVESSLTERVSTLAASVEHGLDKLDGTLVDRPDHEAVVAVVRSANEESERRNAGQLDEAMATFAEIILGPGGGSSGPIPPPRPATRRTARKTPPRESRAGLDGGAGPDGRGAPGDEEPAEV